MPVPLSDAKTPSSSEGRYLPRPSSPRPGWRYRPGQRMDCSARRGHTATPRTAANAAVAVEAVTSTGSECMRQGVWREPVATRADQQ